MGVIGMMIAVMLTMIVTLLAHKATSAGILIQTLRYTLSKKVIQSRFVYIHTMVIMILCSIASGIYLFVDINLIKNISAFAFLTWTLMVFFKDIPFLQSVNPKAEYIQYDTFRFVMSDLNNRYEDFEEDE